MAVQQFALAALPAAPRGQCPQIRRARRYLEATHASVGGLIDSFNVIHEKKSADRTNAQGRLARDEVDLLRAALVFTSSGLDATCQTLVAQCLPTLLARPGTTASKKFDLFLDELGRIPTTDFLVAIKDRDPRARFVDLYVRTKTKASYQGTNDLRERVRDLLGISNSAISKVRIDKLDPFFTARNAIVHDLDYADPASTSVARHKRSPGAVVRDCDTALLLVADIISAAADVVRAD
ncbi:hypothetical protein ACFU7D_01980 [Nocardioides sp. NPDC057577]|uniref:hypothetical protein n=1 Tax=Nocardioides sp. NPDC057577 TaxID=3346171 RepID=UPI00367282DA